MEAQRQNLMEEEMRHQDPANAFKSYKFDRTNPQDFEETRNKYNADMNNRKRHQKLMKQMEEDEYDLEDVEDVGGDLKWDRPGNGMMDVDKEIWGMKVLYWCMIDVTVHL